MQRDTRREFVRSTGLGAAAIGAAAIGLPPAVQAPPASQLPTPQSPPPAPGPRREVVPGSPSPMYSRAVRAGGFVWVAGVVGQKPDSREMVTGRFEAEAQQALENLKASVEASGSTLADVLKCTVFLTDAADFPTFNRIYAAFFPTDPPARSTVVVKELVVAGARLEIDCVACARRSD